jgi:predicted metalloprotease with PDZ domain
LTRYLLFLLVLALGSPRPATAVVEEALGVTSYTVTVKDPASHLLEISIVVDDPGGDSVDFSLPVWTPGSYLVREFARNVQDFRVVRGGTSWRKVDKNTWRVQRGSGPLEVSYRVYANELTVRTSHCDDGHAFLAGAGLFMYVAGAKDRPCRVALSLPPGWEVETALPRTGESTFEASDYDMLVDSPIECGRIRRVEFVAAGKPHVITLWGRGNEDERRLADDFRRLVEAAAAIFGGTLPYDRYVFILHLYPGGSGGLEHRASTAIGASPFVFQNKESYRDFLDLVAHEHFHAWLAKRIRPEAHGPFDYEHEAYTRMLWLTEGGTDFFASEVVRRAGLMSETAYREALARIIRDLDNTPGRTHMSLEEASFDTWVKYYRANEHAVNSQVSYYTKGAVVCAMLDAELRAAPQGPRKLDDVVKLLWERYGSRGVGVPEDAVEAAFVEVGGPAMAEWFDRYVRGTGEIDYDRHLARLGWRLKKEPPKTDSRVSPAPGGWLGAQVTNENGRAMVKSVLEGSPAWTAGLNTGDELLALDGWRVTADSLAERLADRRPGTAVLLTVFRRDELRSIRVVLDELPAEKYMIELIGDGDSGRSQPAEPSQRRRDRS